MPGSVSKNIVAGYANLKPVAAGELRSLTMLGVPVTLRAAVSHVTPSSMSAGSLSDWEYAYQKAAALWSGGELVIEGMQISRNGALYERIGTGVTEATFDAIESLFWVEVAGEDTINDYPASTAVAVGQTCRVTYGAASVFLRNTVAHDTASTFTAVEAANWQYVGQSVTGSFAAATVVVAGTRMSQDGNQYTRNATGTTAATFSAVEAANWTAISLSPFSAWAANRWYTAGELTLTAAGAVVRKLAAGMSGATFDATEAALWLPVLPADLASYTPSVYYFAGDKLAQGQRTLVRSVAGLGALTFSSAEAANWSAYASGTPAWSAATYFFAGDQVTHLGRVLEKLANGLSTATFDAAEGVLWSLVEAPAARSWVASKYYYALEQARDPNGLLVERTAAGLSGAAFNAAEAALWTTCFGSYKAWVAADYIYQYQVVRQGGRLLQRTAVSGVAAATFDATEGAKYIRLASETVAAYSNSFYYYFNEQATHRGLTLTRTTAGLTSTAMDATEASRWFATDDQTPLPFSGTTYYFDGQLMDNAGVIYRRNSATAGLSATTFTLVEAGNWTRVTSAADVAAWPANTYVAAGEVRTTTFNGVTVYIRCTTSHLTAASFSGTEASNWAYVSQSAMATFIGSVVAITGLRITDLGRILERIPTSATAATFIPAEAALWTLIQAPPARDWVASKYYYATEPARSPAGLVIVRTAGGVSGATFDNTEAALWTSQIASTPAWAATTYVYLNQFLVHLGRVIQRTTASGISGATFDATEGAKYQFVSQQDVGGFAIGRYYFVGEQSSYLGLVLTRNTAGVSTAMDATEAGKWTATTTQTAMPLVFSAYYFAGHTVTHLGHIWSRTASGTIGLLFDAAEALLWSRVTGDNITTAWAATQLIDLHEIKVATVAGVTCLLRCETQHYSAATLTQAELNNFSVVSQLNPGTWSAAMPILPGVLLLEDGVTYKRVAAGPTGAVFNATERAAYTIAASTTKIETFTANGTATRFDGYATCNPVAAMSLTLPEQVASDVGRRYTVNNISAFDVTLAVTVGGITADANVKPYSVRTFLVTTTTMVVVVDVYKPLLALKDVTVDYLALDTDDVLLVDTSAANVTVVLPTTFKVGKLITIHKTAAANSLIVVSDTASTQVSTAGAVVSSETFANRFTNLPYFWTGTFWTFYA